MQAQALVPGGGCGLEAYRRGSYVGIEGNAHAIDGWSWSPSSHALQVRADQRIPDLRACVLGPPRRRKCHRAPLLCCCVCMSSSFCLEMDVFLPTVGAEPEGGLRPSGAEPAPAGPAEGGSGPGAECPGGLRAAGRAEGVPRPSRCAQGLQREGRTAWACAEVRAGPPGPHSASGLSSQCTGPCAFPLLLLGSGQSARTSTSKAFSLLMK